MGCLPHQRTKLHDGDEAAEVLHLLVLILTIHHARQIKQFGPLVVEAQQVTMLSQTYEVLHQCATFFQEYRHGFTWYTSVQKRCLRFFFVFLRVLLFLNASRWVSTPMIRGKPCTWQILRNSNVSISKPKLASISIKTWRQKEAKHFYRSIHFTTSSQKSRMSCSFLITSLNCYFINWVCKFMLDCLQHTKGCGPGF